MSTALVTSGIIIITLLFMQPKSYRTMCSADISFNDEVYEYDSFKEYFDTYVLFSYIIGFTSFFVFISSFFLIKRAVIFSAVFPFAQFIFMMYISQHNMNIQNYGVTTDATFDIYRTSTGVFRVYNDSYQDAKLVSGDLCLDYSLNKIFSIYTVILIIIIAGTVLPIVEYYELSLRDKRIDQIL